MYNSVAFSTQTILSSTCIRFQNIFIKSCFILMPEYHETTQSVLLYLFFLKRLKLSVFQQPLETKCCLCHSLSFKFLVFLPPNHWVKLTFLGWLFLFGSLLFNGFFFSWPPGIVLIFCSMNTAKPPGLGFLFLVLEKSAVESLSLLYMEHEI